MDTIFAQLCAILNKAAYSAPEILLINIRSDDDKMFIDSKCGTNGIQITSAYFQYLI